MGAAGTKIAALRPATSRGRGKTSSSSFLRPRGLERERGAQVAAVCYRIRDQQIEFLLVQSRSGRWIFPKGSIESGLTHAQSAALEAFEEAGVHGRIEATPFARYIRRRRGGGRASAKSAGTSIPVHAYLCEVYQLDRPQESKRNRTWFTAEKAKRRLQADREQDFGADLARVVDRALSRIQRLNHFTRIASHPLHRDALHKTRFEAFEGRGLKGDSGDAALARYFLRQWHDARSSAAIEAAVRALLRIGASNGIRQPVLRLGTGAGNVTAIDSGPRTSLSRTRKPVGTRTDRSGK